VRALATWFGEIFKGMTTTAHGMAVTFRHLFRDPVTIEYPDVRVEETLPERYRGILNVDMDICISCHNCDNACPIGCIVIEDVKGEKSSVLSRTTGKPTAKLKYPTSFKIDIAKCMFCGLCTEPCPTGAIHHTRRFEGSVLYVSYLTYEYVKPADLELAKEMVRQAEAKKAQPAPAAPPQPATGTES
jgi:formate hydrogenlyase subunit 6/NADH:ubiquinone oxidoreductase subunit I